MTPAELIANFRAFSLRFLLISVLPTMVLVLMVLLLTLGGAPHHSPDLVRAVARLQALNGSQIGLLLLAALAVGVILYPLQFPMVQFLEGYWGASRIGVHAALMATGRYARRWETWDRRRKPETAAGPADERAAYRRQTYARAIGSLPRPERLMPTRLGNALRSAEDTAGARYGLSTVLITPRLVPQLSPKVADRLADSRLQLDVSIRFCLVWLLATIASLALLVRFGAWLWVCVGTYALAWLSYRAACAAAAGYGAMLAVAIDLHRFDLLRALHQPLPESYRSEVSRNRTLMAIVAGEFAHPEFGVEDLPDLAYQHPPADTSAEPAAPSPADTTAEPWAPAPADGRD